VIVDPIASKNRVKAHGDIFLDGLGFGEALMKAANPEDWGIRSEYGIPLHLGIPREGTG
jgi:hypothetical protein